MGYLKPGVYSRFVATPGTIVLGAGARVPAVIGVAPLTLTIVGEAVTRGSYPYGSQLDSLANTATELVEIGDAIGIAGYVQGTDYQLTAGDIEWIGGGDSPTAGNTYYVTYSYAKVTADYAAKFYSNMSDVEAQYGASIYGNTLSLGIKIAFENGAPFVIGVQVTADNDAAFQAAIDKLRYEISGISATAIVALTTASSVQAYLKTHVEFMSSTNERKERFGLIGMAVSTTISDIIAKATGFAYKRIIFSYDEPTRSVLNSDGTYTDRVLDSTYLACAIAGMMSKYDVQDPLTRKTVVGFKSLGRQLLESERNRMAENGVLLFEEAGGLISVRHGITTSTATPEEQEITVMQIRDFTIKNVRKVLDAIYIATPILSGTVSAIKTSVNSTLKVLSENNVITAWGDITAVQNNSDPRQVDVSFSIKPSYPLNIVMIEFTINPNL